MNKNDELRSSSQIPLKIENNESIKKLKEKIEELEFQKDFQQDITTDMQLITGVDMSKKALRKTVAKEIEQKKRQRIK
ncbi:hypothetical protein [Winogradskyella wichelsiae]|uniref:hypothetical protein n=1 Tax=Winogradskyella wichelsiae TaxID=2697007 RepID=UPI001FE92EC4|nr:hypothetical protein [Winogradskyella wichelsiae]